LSQLFEEKSLSREEENRNNWNQLELVLKEIDEFADIVIVEGQKDKKVLKNLGISKPIIRISFQNRTYSDLIEEISSKYTRVILLSDFDEKGREMNRKLSRMLRQRGLIVNKGYRKVIGKLLRKMRISTIEALNKRTREFT